MEHLLCGEKLQRKNGLGLPKKEEKNQRGMKRIDGSRTNVGNQLSLCTRAGSAENKWTVRTA